MRLKREHEYPTEWLIDQCIWQIDMVPQCRDRDWFGYTHSPEGLIELERGQGREKLFKHFIHEFIHACESEYGVAIPHGFVDDLANELGDLIILWLLRGQGADGRDPRSPGCVYE